MKIVNEFKYYNEHTYSGYYKEYCGSIMWQNKEMTVLLKLDEENENEDVEFEKEQMLKTLRALSYYEDKWDKKMREAALKHLYDTANKWFFEEDEIPDEGFVPVEVELKEMFGKIEGDKIWQEKKFPENKFKESLFIGGILIEKNGNFSFSIEDEGMFFGVCSVYLNGNVKTGFYEGIIIYGNNGEYIKG